MIGVEQKFVIRNKTPSILTDIKTALMPTGDPKPTSELYYQKHVAVTHGIVDVVPGKRAKYTTGDEIRKRCINYGGAIYAKLFDKAILRDCNMDGIVKRFRQLDNISEEVCKYLNLIKKYAEAVSSSDQRHNVECEIEEMNMSWY
jgi:hypothetical protein